MFCTFIELGEDEQIGRVEGQWQAKDAKWQELCNFFGTQINLWNINSWKFYLWPSSLSKFGSKHHFGLQISINSGILHNSISINWIMFIID
jgi:hypothetical protein